MDTEARKVALKRIIERSKIKERFSKKIHPQ
jgi:hypothetical protein